jgi:phage terminase large subunit-like protein
MIKKTNGFLEKYYKDCKSKKHIIGYELFQELEQLIIDMKSDNYFYDTTEADKRIHFIEHVIKLTKSPFYGQQMKLFDFQKAFISALYGFKLLDNTDRFQRSIFLIARKNGKSEFCSALLLTEMIIGGKGLDIVCSSNDDLQASILTDAVDTMRTMIDPESIDTWRNQRNIKCIITDNKIFKLSDKTRNKEGRNIDIAVVDEIHEMKDNVIVKSIEQSQSLKINPKLIFITTEGFVNQGFLDNELIRARAILNQEINDKASERFLIWLYTQDSENEIWQGNRQNRLWEKSNPTLGQVKQFNYLEQQIDLAKQNKADRVFVLSKDFNIKQSNSEAWLKLEDFDYTENYNLEDFRNFLAIGAVDIAETTDLSSAKVLLMNSETNKKYIHSMYFIPEGKLLRSDDKSAGAKYQEWANMGLVKICEGNYIDTSIIADWFFSLYTDYGFRFYKTGYDAKFANEFINKMDSYGFETESVWQRPEILSQPINMVEADLKTKQIIGLNEIDKWCLSNATLKIDSRGLGILDKIKGQVSKKIDGAVSLVILYETFRRYRTSFIENIKG